jgi:hypothetical protein
MISLLLKKILHLKMLKFIEINSPITITSCSLTAISVVKTKLKYNNNWQDSNNNIFNATALI